MTHEEKQRNRVKTREETQDTLTDLLSSIYIYKSFPVLFVVYSSLFSFQKKCICNAEIIELTHVLS